MTGSLRGLLHEGDHTLRDVGDAAVTGEGEQAEPGPGYHDRQPRGLAEREDVVGALGDADRTADRP
jgi:hypothetical protein